MILSNAGKLLSRADKAFRDKWQITKKTILHISEKLTPERIVYRLVDVSDRYKSVSASIINITVTKWCMKTFTDILDTSRSRGSFFFPCSSWYSRVWRCCPCPQFHNTALEQDRSAGPGTAQWSHQPKTICGQGSEDRSRPSAGRRTAL